MIEVTRPVAGEFGPAAAGYIALAPAIFDAARQLDSQRDAFVSLLAPMSDAQSAHRYAPEKWSVKELLGHICDTERILSYRLLRIGRGDATPLPGFDEHAYAQAAATAQRPFGDVLDEWMTIRNATRTLVRGLPAEAWARRGTANDSSVSARALLYIILGHVEHHRNILEERYGFGTGTR